MADDAVELSRFTDPAAARQAMRTLLAAGCAASTRRDGDEHVLEVSTDQLTEAARHLGLPVPSEVPARAEADTGADLAGDDVAGDDVAPDDLAVDVAGDDLGREDVGPDDLPVEVESEPVGGGADLPVEDAVEGDDRPIVAGVEPPVESIFGAGPVLPPPPDPATVSAGGPEPAAEADPTATDRPDVDGDGYAIVAMVSGEAEGRQVAATLLEHGIGVDLVDADAAGYGRPPGSSGPSTKGARIVRVLPTDVDRARTFVEGPLPRRTLVVEGTLPTVIDGEEVRGYFGGRLNVTRTQLTLIILAYVAALILIPLFFFWGTQQLLDPGIEDPNPTLPGPGVTAPR